MINRAASVSSLIKKLCGRHSFRPSLSLSLPYTRTRARTRTHTRAHVHSAFRETADWQIKLKLTRSGNEVACRPSRGISRVWVLENEFRLNNKLPR